MKTRIQELRKQNKVTQEELALALGVTRQTIISLENGKYNASLQLAFKISRFFGKSIEDIFLFEEEELIMWLNQLFIENPIDFEKRCRNRIVYGICFILLGAAAIGLSFAVGNHAMVMYLEQGYKDFMPGFYGGTGFGLAAAGVITIMRNLKYLRNPELKEKRRIYETDERNRMLGLRCWAYTGYTMMLSLYIGILISGFISMTVTKTLISVAAFFAVLLLVFRRLLQKVM